MVKATYSKGILLALCLSGVTSYSQSSGSAGNQPQSAAQSRPASLSSAIVVQQPGDPSFRGSVSQGTASGTAIPLTLNDAITRGLKSNLGMLTSEQSSREVRAQRYRALSLLLPTVTGQLAMTEQQLNLQALGFLFPVPGIPHIVGPYSYQDVQANATVPLFNFSSISGVRASREISKASALSVRNARDLVVQAVGNSYLQIIADAARVVATQAEIEADRAQFVNASRRHDAGVATGIDVLRSQVELKQRQQALVAQANQFEKDKLTLGRVIGLPPGQDFTVADPSPSVPIEAITVQDALTKAYEHRPDYQAAKAQLLAAQFTLRAARAQRYPALQASGFYGDEGLRILSNSHGVFQATGSVTFNIFDGGRIKADVLESSAELKNRENELQNLRGQIDYEVRTTLLDLKSAADQVDVAHSSLDLANEALKESRDRFAAGVTNSVEVVQAQQAVAEAYESLISAQFQYNLAKVSLARSLGLAEAGIRAYFNQQP